jgi:hypothetical protein
MRSTELLPCSCGELDVYVFKDMGYMAGSCNLASYLGYIAKELSSAPVKRCWRGINMIEQWLLVAGFKCMLVFAAERKSPYQPSLSVPEFRA